MSFQVASFIRPSMAELKNAIYVSALALSRTVCPLCLRLFLFCLGLDEATCIYVRLSVSLNMYHASMSSYSGSDCSMSDYDHSACGHYPSTTTEYLPSIRGGFFIRTVIDR